MGQQAQGLTGAGAGAGRRRGILRAGLTLALLAAAPAASARTLHVYSSLPLHGAPAAQTLDIVRGIRLALSEAGGRAGRFDIRYQSLDDSTRAAGNWDPFKADENARRVARDSAAILYIGEFNSGASAVSIPTLNRKNIPQISPSNTYNGLTTGELGTCCGDPERWYPTGKRTYLRIVPRDAVQAAALATVMRDDGCTKVGLASDKDTYGHGLARLVRTSTRRLGLRRTRIIGIDRLASYYRAVGEEYRDRGIDCFFFGGVTSNHAWPLYRDVHKILPKIRLYGGDGVCESGFTRHVGPALRPLFRCSVATLPIAEYPGGSAFLGAFAALFGRRNPDPYALYGYEAMKLGLDAIAALGAAGDQRESVRQALFETRNRASVLGTYSITSRGDTTLRDYGIYRADDDGSPVFDHRVVAG